MKNGNLSAKIANDEDVDDYDKAKPLNSMSSDFGSCIFSHCKKLMNDVIRQIVGFSNNSIYYTHTEFLYIHKNYWSEVVDKEFVGKALRPGKKDHYNNSCIFYVWFLSPKKTD